MLALALGGRTVAEWKAVMTPQELSDWVEFWKVQPFDDYHRHHRPAALIAHSMSGADMNDLIDWLRHEIAPESEKPKYSQADLNTMAAFGMKPPRKD